MKYKVILDNGKPQEEIATDEEDLKSILEAFYLSNKGSDFQFNAYVLNEKNEDISESQFISELIADIMDSDKDNSLY